MQTQARRASSKSNAGRTWRPWWRKWGGDPNGARSAENLPRLHPTMQQSEEPRNLKNAGVTMSCMVEHVMHKPCLATKSKKKRLSPTSWPTKSKPSTTKQSTMTGLNFKQWQCYPAVCNPSTSLASVIASINFPNSINVLIAPEHIERWDAVRVTSIFIWALCMHVKRCSNYITY